jgi:Raf kinase inhibitor-like YbhB/YbcL family protein
MRAVLLALAIWGLSSSAAAAATVIERIQPEVRLDVASPAFEPATPIPARYAAEQQNLSPPLSWSRGPRQTRSYAVVVEDPDAPGRRPFVHWIAHGIPADVTTLEPGAGQPDAAGLVQGSNDLGERGWFGMRPPRGDPPHRYHFQIFALDTTLELPPGADRETLVEAMASHVLAAGELVGTYQRP